MKNLTVKFSVLFLALSILVSSCGSMTGVQKGAGIGAGSGAAIGAGLGALFGKDAQSAAIGAAIGTAVGTTAGALIGNKMDKKAAELEAALDDANVETVTDVNNLTAIKVTFDSGILFATNSATLSEASKASLREFASTMVDLPETDFTIQGHTDNTGSREVNERLSLQRAQSVANYLQSCGINASRLTEEGLAYDYPVADNSTAEGRQQNRRVEVYITANEEMIREAEAEAKN